jgi:hypothetical protein
MVLPEGSRVGWWRPSGEALSDAPIVLLDSEGERRALGRSSAEFLSSIARGTTDMISMDPEEDQDRRPALAKWLNERGAWIEEDDIPALADLTSQLSVWLDDWSEQRERRSSSTPRDFAGTSPECPARATGPRSGSRR